MIFKNYEINKIDLNKNKILLLYGQNEGFKNEVINTLFKNSDISVYDEKEILDNSQSFLENLLNKSLFDTSKRILIKRATDKFVKILHEISTKNIDDSIIILNSGNLEKKSKLRALFEKSKEYACIAFYPDTEKTMSDLASTFFKNKNVSMSQLNINLIISKCNGDREVLKNELNKLYYYTKNGKKLSNEIIAKLTNLTEDHSVSELIDNCLAKNSKKTISILNENNFSNEDCILIIRVFLNKSKKILKLSNEFNKNKDIDLTISTAKPPIFWKDKEITKQQVFRWKPENIKDLIYNLNEIELLVKKNVNNSVNLITNFIIESSNLEINN